MRWAGTHDERIAYLDTNGQLRAYGANSFGELGCGTAELVPIEIGAPTAQLAAQRADTLSMTASAARTS